MRSWVQNDERREIDVQSDMNTTLVFQPAPQDQPDATAAYSNSASTIATANDVPQRANDVTEHTSEAQVEVRPNWRKRLKQKSKKGIRAVFWATVSPNSNFYYFWEGIVTVGWLYNMIIMVLYVFDDFESYMTEWYIGNYFFDACFLVDIFVRSRKTFLQEGSEVQDLKTLAFHYIGTREFYLDILSILPFDLIALVITIQISFFRANRLFKYHAVWEFSERAQFRTNYPHGMRIFMLIVTCYLLFHVNACVYFTLSRYRDINSNDRAEWIFTYSKNANPIFPTCRTVSPIEDDNECNADADEEDNKIPPMEYLKEYWLKPGNMTLSINCSNFLRQYTLSLYWSALTLTTCGQQPYPNAWEQNALEVVDTVIGLIVFAVIVGSVGNVVSTMNTTRSRYQEMMDGLKFYMGYRNVDFRIQRRVVACIEYDFNVRVKQDEKEIFESLPPRLQGEMSVQLHMESLKKVELLNGLEIGLLYELVLRIKEQMLVPGDYLCRKGEPAKEMYINKKGLLQRKIDNGVWLNMKEGSVIGELSILNIERDGVLAKRLHTVKSSGYTEVYILRREDVTEVLQDYPIVREQLHAKAHSIMLSSEDYDSDCSVGMWSKSLEEKLAYIEDTLDVLDQNVSTLFNQYLDSSVALKQATTVLEETYKKHFQEIKRDYALRSQQDQ